MGIPLEVASTPKELEKAVEKHSACDLIFIDTLQKYKDMTKVEEVINRDYAYLCNKLGFKMVY